MDYIFLIAVSYLVVINIAAVAVTVADKQRAKNNRWRVSEASLLAVSALGGAVAMYITMRVIHHKTKKAKFMVGIPAIFIAEVLALALLFFLVSRV